ncbi:TonB family protein [Halocynthiibacter namhaensis]|uniref:TonB family protein n=1 Tax=Halocynthiibacter namhaensis TaxID=1290553 RepID=UPI00068AB3B6|nr:TonB family protein [Halocynthiibacter namhaensis]
MKSRKIMTIGAVILTSCALHAGGFAWTYQANTVQISGGSPAEVARLGNGFIDMTSGTLSPVTADDTTKTAPLETAQPATTQPVTATSTTPPVQTSPSSPTRTVSSASPTLATVPPPSERITAIATEVREAQADTPRPASRPVTRPEPRRAQPSPTPQASRQGGNQNTRRGQSTGQETATATEASPKSNGSASTAGNAAASNYDGLVWRRISRTRRSRSGGRGTAVVSFHIETSGTPSRVRIQRSSGKPALDQAAIDHIHRAAPFPSPPAGARRDFGYTYEGRG